MELTAISNFFNLRYNSTLAKLEILKNTASNNYERQKLIDKTQELDLLNDIIQATNTLEEFINEQ